MSVAEGSFVVAPGGTPHDFEKCTASPALYCLSSRFTYAIDATFPPGLTPGTHVRFAAWAVGGNSNVQTVDGSFGTCYTPPVQWDVTLD
jgi:hypothetical protein